MTLHIIIKQKMQEQGISQSEMARRLGISQASVWAWIHGDTVPRLPMLHRIAGVLGCPVTELLSDEELDDRLREALRTMSPEQKEALLRLIAPPPGSPASGSDPER